jgi:hypothetical protein
MEPIGRPKGIAVLVLVAAAMFVTAGCGNVCPAGESAGIAPTERATSVGWRFQAPEGLKQSWCSPAGHGLGRVVRVVLFLGCAAVISVVAFMIGIVLLPLELFVFAIATFVSKNLFWLTMIVTWKYVLLFHALF